AVILVMTGRLTTGIFGDSDDAGRTELLADQPAPAQQMPDDQRPDRGQGDQGGSQQGRDGAAQPGPRLGSLLEDLTQPAGPRFRSGHGCLAGTRPLLVSHGDSARWWSRIPRARAGPGARQPGHGPDGGPPPGDRRAGGSARRPPG